MSSSRNPNSIVNNATKRKNYTYHTKNVNGFHLNVPASSNWIDCFYPLLSYRLRYYRISIEKQSHHWILLVSLIANKSKKCEHLFYGIISRLAQWQQHQCMSISPELCVICTTIQLYPHICLKRQCSAD